MNTFHLLDLIMFGVCLFLLIKKIFFKFCFRIHKNDANHPHILRSRNFCPPWYSHQPAMAKADEPSIAECISWKMSTQIARSVRTLCSGHNLHELLSSWGRNVGERSFVNAKKNLVQFVLRWIYDEKIPKGSWFGKVIV